ncbi:hypothetical protein [Cohaesibacter celericrescens]|nr:hypothetical protein [Cohaesibacter celericrescens]
MIAIAMYILLGVFVTLLLTLFVLPLIWRRAIRLTEKRVMAEMPISYSELQAEKDMQRAEQAIKLRRLEVIAETRLENMANQAMKIDRLNANLQARATEISEREADILSLKDDLAAQQQEMAQTVQTLADTSHDLEQAKQTISDLETTQSDLEQQLLHLETNYSEQKIELIAQSTRIENYKEELSELHSRYNTEIRSRAEAEGLLSQKSDELDHNKERLEAQRSKLDSLQTELADMDATISNLNIQLERSKAQKPVTDPESQQKFAEAEARRVEAEAKVASLTMQLQHGMNAAEGDDLSAFVDTLQNENAQLEARLSDTIAKSDALSKELADFKQKAAQPDNNAPLSPKEMMLRNEIKNIAAQITGFTAQSEGEESVIHALLSDDDSDKPASNGTVDAIPKPNTEFVAPAAETEEKKDAWNEVFSLAERIRKMTNRSEDKNANP